MILDANSLSAMADGDPIEARLETAAALAIPVIALGEYKDGIRQSRNRTRYEPLLTEVTANCRLLIIDEGTIDEDGKVRRGLKRSEWPIPGNDLWIASWARRG